MSMFMRPSTFSIVVSLAWFGVCWAPSSHAEQAVFAGDYGPDARFGEALAIDGDRAVVGAPAADGYQGSLYIYQREGGIWAEKQVIVLPPDYGGVSLGFSVSLKGDLLVAGAPAHLSALAGEVHVYRFDGVAFEPEAILTGGGGTLGHAVATDGALVVAGAPDAGEGQGEAIVWYDDGGGFQIDQIFFDQSADDFGWSVAVDGGTVAVGAPSHSNNTFVAVYQRDLTGAWSGPEKLADTAGQQCAEGLGCRFGAGVALEGNRLAIVAGGMQSPEGSFGGGWVQIWDNSGGVWKLLDQQSSQMGFDGGFSETVAMSGDRVLVGNPSYDLIEVASDVGGVATFTFDGTKLTRGADVTFDAAGSFTAAGAAIAIDGVSALAGGPGDSGAGPETGVAMAFCVDGDFDNDGVCNADDGCPFSHNPRQTDTDDDGLQDACDQCPAGVHDVPRSCADIAAAFPAAPDGHYVIWPQWNQGVEVYCHNLAAAPTEYITLPRTSPFFNVSTYFGDHQDASAVSDCKAASDVFGTTAITAYRRVRLDLATFEIDVTDVTFATVVQAGASGVDPVDPSFAPIPTSVDYGTAAACYSPCSVEGIPRGTANVDVSGTGFDLGAEFYPSDLPGTISVPGIAEGTYDFNLHGGYDLTGGGFCGAMAAFGGMFLFPIVEMPLYFTDASPQESGCAVCPDADVDGACDQSDGCVDADFDGFGDGTNANATCWNEGTDTDDSTNTLCTDQDADGCDDCTNSPSKPSPWGDGPDLDQDGICDVGDDCQDVDFDTFGDGSLGNAGCQFPDVDFDDNDPCTCADTDFDTCDDCVYCELWDPNFDGSDLDGDGACDKGDTCTDLDGDGVGDGGNGNVGCAVPDVDNATDDPQSCADTDLDGCDDCSGEGLLFDPLDDGFDSDLDGICDFTDDCHDFDNDGLAPIEAPNNGCVSSQADSDDTDRFICADSDDDGCDDCSSGTFDADADGEDLDGDGLCDSTDGCVDVDDDGLGNGTGGNSDCVDPTTDSDDADPFVCGDVDTDGCDDCSVAGTWSIYEDGPDGDFDGLCDAGDTCSDYDYDGVGDGTNGNVGCSSTTDTDVDDTDPCACTDSDLDQCDDCAANAQFGECFFDPLFDGPDGDGDGQCDVGDTCNDVDGDGVGDGVNGNTGCLTTAVDTATDVPTECADTDDDGCDDCSSGSWSPGADGADGDADGLCDLGDDCFDADGDGVAAAGEVNSGCLTQAITDSDDGDAFTCGDADADGCDDCAVGIFDPTASAVDVDLDGICDAVDRCIDEDLDGWGNADSDNADCPHGPTVDIDDGDAKHCVDTDADGCDDCFGGSWDPAADGPDTDGDGQCDDTDTCDDGDGDGVAVAGGADLTCAVQGVSDINDGDPSVCADSDADTCDDCTSGVFDPGNDGADADGDGVCDAGDGCSDADGDGVGDGTSDNLGCLTTDVDSNDTDPNICVDSNGDGCDDCIGGTFAAGGVNACTDGDGDGVVKLDDNCDETANPSQDDLDGDGLGDACDADIDGDGVSNDDEQAAGTDATDPDSDDDGLDDGEERDAQTDPLSPDSDGDGLSDDDEVNVHATDPNKGDSDDGGMNDADEVLLGLDPNDGGADDWNKSKVVGGGVSDCENSAAGGSTPLGWLLGVLLALYALRRRRGAVLAAGAAAVAIGVAGVMPAPALAAGAGGFSVTHFQVVPKRDRIFSVEGTLMPKHLSVYGGTWTHFAKNLLAMNTDFPGGRAVDQLLGEQVLQQLSVGVGLVDRIALELSLPVALTSAGNTEAFGGVGAAGVGDLSLAVRGSILGGPFQTIGLAASLTIHAPITDSSDLVGDGGFRVVPRFVVSARGGPALASLTLGASFRTQEGTFRGLDLTHELVMGVGARFDLFRQGVLSDLSLGVEVIMRTALSGEAFDPSHTPMEIVAGPRAVFIEHIQLEVGAGAGIVPGYGAPDFRVFGGIAWLPEMPPIPDTDQDGLLDNIDQCLADPEDADGFEDGDGCPDPDNDEDGVRDTRDRCPIVAQGEGYLGCPLSDGDADAVADAYDRCPSRAQTDKGLQGCPPGLDSDGDGIMDMYDKCPRSAAPKSSVGCPSGLDSDGDGLLDAVDKCPYVAKRGGSAGCPPDLDSDGDGLLDAIDRCPLRASPVGSSGSSVYGCPEGLDSDGDGLLDDLDRCPTDPSGDHTKALGCPSKLDSDGDGLLDAFDRCPHHAAGGSGSSGCPADLDSDGDGLLDVYDKCPRHAAPGKEMGCPPDLDSDGDGLLDAIDRCPQHKGAADASGCPDGLDSDGDGLLDRDDRCPLQKVTADGANGCPPSADEDRDKVPDMRDACTGEKEDKRGTKPDDGCPAGKMLVIKDCQLKFSDNVFFASGRSVIKKRAIRLLEDVSKTVARAVSVDKLVVEGHTDNVGGKKFNQALSERRAKAVVSKLRQLGIVPEELAIEAVGWGLTKPLADNATGRGRAKNRRVQFRIIGGKCKDEVLR